MKTGFMAARMWPILLLLSGLPVLVGAQQIDSREDALAALASEQGMLRLDAVNALARVGLMEDADALIEALYDDSDQVRAQAERALWQVWSRSGDSSVDELLRAGTHYLNEGQMGRAIALFTEVIERKPEFAEGWNKRATAYFMMEDLELSLKDCDEVIKRNPHHFGALSGYGLIYVRLGDLERALEYFERALQVNPNMHGVEQSIEMILYKLGKAGKQQT